MKRQNDEMKILPQRISSGLYVETDMLLNGTHCGKNNSLTFKELYHPDYILSNENFQQE